ncbi:MAG: mycothiol system anti-sigma-R factor [Propionibacteriaceae bacterium]|jgi:mycothiol system anti-sigma-R factor|nr:mycothiol system anti-sigma-R factor [Propionibacteriaceae bacterium]
MDEHERCHRILARVFAFHDEALDEAEADEIRQHLLGCEPCLGKFEVERAMRVLIRRSFGESAPSRLRERIREKLSLDSFNDQALA